MYEIAQVAGNKIEAACAIKSLSNIMGQISSNHHHQQQSNHQNGKNRHFHRHSSSVVPTSQYHQPPQAQQIFKIKEMKKPPTATITTTTTITKDIYNRPERPITISEMNAYNIEKNDYSSSGGGIVNVVSGISTLPTSNSTTATTTTSSSKNKEFYKIGEGYHKTDNCYYKTSEGGYHKLPTDSYHKMSEGCYNKLPDGSFRKLNVDLSITNQSQQQTPNNGSQYRIKSNVMKFLRRTKSHTPATIKDMQKEKSSVIVNSHHRGGAGAGGGVGESGGTVTGGSNTGANRRIMINMLDGGGLPIVATSKRATDKTKHSQRSGDKDGGSKSKHSKVSSENFYFQNNLNR